MNRLLQACWLMEFNKAALSLLILGCATLAAVPQARAVVGHSFESDLEGFRGNGAGVTISQDTIGATDGSKSLKINLVKGATYVGALDETLDPNIVGDPPGIDVVQFDLTIQQAFPPEGFVDIFIVFFGLEQGTTEPGLEVSFQNNRVAVGDLPIGTHKISMELTSATHPITFEGEMSFNDVFGVAGSGPNDIIPTGFQITVNKSTQAPWVGYIDKVEFINAMPGDFDGDGDVDGNDFLVWQRGETSPPLDPATLAEWKANYGAGPSLASVAAAVPEPVSCFMLAIAGAACFGMRRRMGPSSLLS